MAGDRFTSHNASMINTSPMANASRATMATATSTLMRERLTVKRALVLATALLALAGCRPTTPTPDHSPVVTSLSPSPSGSATPTPSPDPIVTTPAPPTPTAGDPTTPGSVPTPKRAIPKPTHTMPKPQPHPTTKPPVTGNVRPGAFCSTAGATGTYNGRVYTCKVSATENKLRWRR